MFCIHLYGYLLFYKIVIFFLFLNLAKINSTFSSRKNVSNCSRITIAYLSIAWFWMNLILKAYGPFSYYLFYNQKQIPNEKCRWFCLDSHPTKVTLFIPCIAGIWNKIYIQIHTVFCSINGLFEGYYTFLFKIAKLTFLNGWFNMPTV